MAFNIVMPKLGESVQEATITKWFIAVNDKIEEDQAIVEIATDKVDSEIPSPVEGIVTKVLFNVGDKVAVGTVIAVIAEEGDAAEPAPAAAVSAAAPELAPASPAAPLDTQASTRFYSPLVKSIAEKENVSFNELEQIVGTGSEGRVSKDDILKYVANRKPGQTLQAAAPVAVAVPTPAAPPVPAPEKKPQASVSIGAEDYIVEMDRMRRMIADHMVMSKHTSPHVTSMVEADMTNVVTWRNKVKGNFEKKENEKLTFMPIIIEAVAKALKDFPAVNASVDGYNVIFRKHINVGVAVSLPSGNLIVPVIKDTDYLTLTGITKKMNKLANDARDNKLSPDDIQGGTFTISNFGSFKNVMGTPIINQPQVAILAVGTIEKKPAVLELPTGDIIAIRHKMFLSLSYDHRVVDGMLGGGFLRRVADYLENFDMNREA